MTTTVQRVVHASVLIDFDGARILTDPWLSERRGYYQGEPRSVRSAAELPPLAGIVISHGHYDHCDLDALAGYPTRTCPLPWSAGSPGGSAPAASPTSPNSTPGRAPTSGPSGSPPPPPSTASPRSPSCCGTTGPRCSSARTRCASAPSTRSPGGFPGLDLGLLPINGLRIRPAFNKQVVMDATEAAELTSVLRPRLAVPIHYAFGALTSQRVRPTHRKSLSSDLPVLWFWVVPGGAPPALFRASHDE
jgi:L-ascorbate metabolism protein UlaG (beta-lactamase superfamily)